MQDRVSQYPGRVKLTPVSGQENVYDMEWADGATVVGTALNKANLLTDSTATALGLTSSATPNTAFSQLNTKINANNTKFNNATWKQIGTANISGLSADSSFTISLSRSLSDLVEIFVFLDNGVCDETNYIRLLYIDFSETFNPSISGINTSSYSASNPTPLLSLSSSKDDAAPAYGAIHFVFPIGKTKGYFDGVTNYQGYNGSTLLKYNNSCSGIFNAGTTTTVIKGKILSSQTGNTSSVVSGTITVYGRDNP